jgi:uncharacterized MAPEG superfamily protein
MTISSILAVLAVTLGLIAYLDKSDVRLKVILFVQAILLGSHFAIEGSISASIITFLIAPLNLLSAFKISRPLYPAFALIILIAGLFGFNGVQDIFPIAAVCISLYALYHLEGVYLRGSLIACSMLWIIHDVAYDLPIILFMDITILVLNVFATMQMIRAQNGSPSSASPVEARGITNPKNTFGS